jgi:hypothetical protein
MGECENGMVMSHRQQLFLPGQQPFSAFSPSASGAPAMTAAIIENTFDMAVWTALDMPTEG